MSDPSILKVDSNELNTSIIDDVVLLPKLLRGRSLEDIVSLEENLRNDVKQLDAEMKNLAYDNYNKLIQTTEIINNLIPELDGIRGELTTLESLFQHGLTTKNEIMSNLQPHIEMYSSTVENSPLNILDKLFLLPELLKYHINRQELDQFCSLYKSKYPMLKQLYSHQSVVKLIKNVDILCETCKKIIYNKINDIELFNNSQSTILSDYFDFLLSLNETKAKICEFMKEIITQKIEIEINYAALKHLDVNTMKSFLLLMDQFEYIFKCINMMYDEKEELKHETFFFDFINEIITEFSARVTTFQISVHNMETFSGHFELIFIKLHQINKLLSHKLSENIHRLGQDFKATLLNNSLLCLITRAIEIIHDTRDIFVNNLNDKREFNKNGLVELKEHNYKMLIELKKDFYFFLDFFRILIEHTSTSNLFYRLFDEMFSVSYKSSFGDEFFKQFNIELQKLMAYCSFNEHLEFYLQISLIVYQFGHDVLPDMEDSSSSSSSSGNLTSSQFVSLFNDTANKFVTIFIQKYAEIHFVAPILNYFIIAHRSQSQNCSISHNFFMLLEVFVSNLIILRGYSSLGKVNAKVSYQFVQSSQKYDTNKFDVPCSSSQICIYDDIIDNNLIAAISSIYKMVAKSFVECFLLTHVDESLVLKSQQELYQIKMIFSQFITLPKKYHQFELIILQHTSYCGFELFKLLSLHELANIIN